MRYTNNGKEGEGVFRSKVCAICGKTINHWQWKNGLLVCADDRTCYPKNPTRAIKALRKNKLKYGDVD